MRKIWSKMLFCTVVLAALAGCRSTPNEALIRQGIEAAANAAEHAHAAALGDVLSEDFDGNAGALARSDLLQLLRAAAFRGETIHTLTGPVEIEQRGARYVARFTVTLTSGGKLLPAQMGVYKVETAWRRDGREWHCYSATWTSVGQD
ncbi:hypothetical protein [Dyella humicola]|uniref:hypothetical protein n=1 Tax=Dyella humicola TaxID=2992126 RepID=UPI002253C156|nr:hypothetical protein [Dyella humicola]